MLNSASSSQTTQNLSLPGFNFNLTETGRLLLEKYPDIRQIPPSEFSVHFPFPLIARDAAIKTVFDYTVRQTRRNNEAIDWVNTTENPQKANDPNIIYNFFPREDTFNSYFLGAMNANMLPLPQLEYTQEARTLPLSPKEKQYDEAMQSHDEELHTLQSYWKTLRLELEKALKRQQQRPAFQNLSQN